MQITNPRNQLNRLNPAAITEKLHSVEIRDTEGFIGWHSDTNMWQVPRNPWSKGGNVQKRIDVQKCGKKRAYLLFGKGEEHGSVSVLISYVEYDELFSPTYDFDSAALMETVH